MGYYSTLSFNGKVENYNKQSLEKLNKELEKGKFEGFEGMSIKIDEEGNFDIDSTDYHCKFYQSQEFAKALSKIIEKGEVYLYFDGEDGESWGYKITPGKIENLFKVFLTEEEYNRLKKEQQNG